MDRCDRWYVLGLKLKVSVVTLDRIRAQFHDSRDQLLEMLKTWLQTSDNPSWWAVIDALRSPGVGLFELSDNLWRKMRKTEVDESKR